LAKLVSEVWPKVSSGEIRPTIFKTFPIEMAEDAHKLLEDGKSIGKVVLIVK